MFSQIIARLNSFEVYANSERFKKIFGQKAGHLWHKFSCSYNNNSVQFFMSLDDKNQVLLLAYLQRYTKDY